MKMKTQLLAACVASICAVSTQAQVAGSGISVGGSIGQSKLKNDSFFPGLDTTNTGGKLYAGYAFSPFFSLELGYVDFGSFGYAGGSVKAHGPFLDAVGTIPFTPQWSGLVRAGGFQGTLDNGVASDHGNSYKVGLGVQYNVTANTGVRAEYERYKFDALNSKPNVDLLSVGVNYRF